MRRFLFFIFGFLILLCLLYPLKTWGETWSLIESSRLSLEHNPSSSTYELTYDQPLEYSFILEKNDLSRISILADTKLGVGGTYWLELYTNAGDAPLRQSSINTLWSNGILTFDFPPLTLEGSEEVYIRLTADSEGTPPLLIYLSSTEGYPVFQTYYKSSLSFTTGGEILMQRLGFNDLLIFKGPAILAIAIAWIFLSLFLFYQLYILVTSISIHPKSHH